MDDANPYAAPQAEIVEALIERAEPQSLPEAIRRSAWTGFKRATCIAGPIAIGMFLLVLGVTAFEFAVNQKRLGYKMLALLASPFVIYAASCAGGLQLGVLLVLVRYLLHGGRSPSSFWSLPARLDKHLNR